MLSGGAKGCGDVRREVSLGRADTESEVGGEGSRNEDGALLGAARERQGAGIKAQQVLSALPGGCWAALEAELTQQVWGWKQGSSRARQSQ